ncbi:MAG: hypothetical protein QOJ24_824 [Mycobacterium sp.]|nr:hypothetical protein [Mycobacterium sp.]
MLVGFGAVLIEQEESPIGGVLEFLGADADGGAHEVDLDLREGGRVDEARHLAHGLADDLDMLAVDLPEGLSGGGRRQQRWQRFPGQRSARTQQCSLGQSPVGLGRRDAPPNREHIFPGLGAQLRWRGLGLQPRQQAVGLGGQLAGQGFEGVEGVDQLRAGEQLDVAGRQRGTQRGHRLLHHRP